jgi:hypothetical protein
MTKYEYFDRPTQVQFCDHDGVVRGGIAYGGEIICGCCGGIFTIEEVYEFACGIEEPIIPYHDWEPLEETIIGN